MDDRFGRGLERFNAQDYFEAHEVWEDLWHEYREPDRTFLQGLIQVAAGLYHLDAGNPKGAASQLAKGAAKLQPYAPIHQGVDLAALLGDVSACLKALDGDAPASVIPPSDFPAIRHASVSSPGT